MMHYLGRFPLLFVKGGARVDTTFDTSLTVVHQGMVVRRLHASFSGYAWSEMSLTANSLS